ncbi:hypothetical protein [Microviridae sp.]|nr:hypothetical protein [Microviridae sp.]
MKTEKKLSSKKDELINQKSKKSSSQSSDKSLLSEQEKQMLNPEQSTWWATPTIVQNRSTYRGAIGESFIEPSKTIPADELTIRELVMRQQKGIEVREYKPIYDSTDLHDLNRMDPVERGLYFQSVSRIYTQAKEQYEEEFKLAKIEYDKKQAIKKAENDAREKAIQKLMSEDKND